MTLRACYSGVKLITRSTEMFIWDSDWVVFADERIGLHKRRDVAAHFYPQPPPRQPSMRDWKRGAK